VGTLWSLCFVTLFVSTLGGGGGANGGRCGGDGGGW
jgi:hypothetical protein